MNGAFILAPLGKALLRTFWNEENLESEVRISSVVGNLLYSRVSSSGVSMIVELNGVA